MKCNNCNKSYDNDYKFCPNCGNKVLADEIKELIDIDMQIKELEISVGYEDILSELSRGMEIYCLKNKIREESKKLLKTLIERKYEILLKYKGD